MTDHEFAEPLQQIDGVYVRAGRRKLLYFGGCDYHRLSSHPRISRALHGTLDQYGLTSAASRKTTGNHILFEAAEKSAAKYFGSEGALLVSSGYLANIAVAQGLRGLIERAFVDERCHSSLIDALQFLTCPITRFRHCDPRKLLEKYRECRTRKALVVSDGMFAFDGSIAPLCSYRRNLGRNFLLWVDDAHAGGVLGEKGRGSIEAAGLGRNGVIQTVTFSKAFGVYGGAILCDQAFRKRVIAKSSAISGNTPLPLPLAGGIVESLRVLDRKLLKKLRLNVSLFWEALGYPACIDGSPIIAISNAPTLSRTLLAAGIYPTLIRYPGGPATGYFRFAISSAHTPEQVLRLAKAVLRAKGRLLGGSISP